MCSCSLEIRLNGIGLALTVVKSKIQTVDRLKPSRSPCPVGRASRILGDRWVILILREAFLGATRFDEFLPNTGINRAALTTRLTALVEHGILERDPPDARRAAYRLTPAGHELAPVLSAMRDWAGKWLFDPQGNGEWRADHFS